MKLKKIYMAECPIKPGFLTKAFENLEVSNVDRHFGEIGKNDLDVLIHNLVQTKGDQGYQCLLSSYWSALDFLNWATKQYGYSLFIHSS